MRDAGKARHTLHLEASLVAPDKILWQSVHVSGADRTMIFMSRDWRFTTRTSRLKTDIEQPQLGSKNVLCSEEYL